MNAKSNLLVFFLIIKIYYTFDAIFKFMHELHE
jgi:hypothetical protein